ncbi:hypothetical protein B9Z55_024427 [Caenorhabditis nigoni]|uniref:Uncharacterized protein n=1 Tax=Caenorhabditis nigoni TaxID=1611254 RepID=A0A2G5SUS0_9PELO|nr:hypothetical protein B9Z55_024427 [Caenorhabditis nigoni]
MCFDDDDDDDDGGNAFFLLFLSTDIFLFLPNAFTSRTKVKKKASRSIQSFIHHRHNKKTFFHSLFRIMPSTYSSRTYSYSRREMSERRIDVNRSNYSVIDNEFGNMRDRFEQEMRRVEEEMKRLRSEFEENVEQKKIRNPLVNISKSR